MTAIEITTFNRARAEVARMHDVLVLRPVAHVSRGVCLDCDQAVVLQLDGSCPCGSRSVMQRRAA
jgi:hypothetical protein